MTDLEKLERDADRAEYLESDAFVRWYDTVRLGQVQRAVLEIAQREFAAARAKFLEAKLAEAKR